MKFWKIVNAIENNADRQEIYSLGVVLQNMEEHVLRRIGDVLTMNVEERIK